MDEYRPTLKLRPENRGRVATRSKPQEDNFESPTGRFEDVLRDAKEIIGRFGSK